MAHLEGVEISVSRVADDAYRVVVESECSVHKFDLSGMDLIGLIEEALEELVARGGECDECEFCYDDSCLLDAIAKLARQAREVRHEK